MATPTPAPDQAAAARPARARPPAKPTPTPKPEDILYIRNDPGPVAERRSRSCRSIVGENFWLAQLAPLALVARLWQVLAWRNARAHNAARARAADLHR